MSEKLFPCPFCGSVDVVLNRVATGGGWGTLCRSCHTYQDTRSEGHGLAIAAWNRRAKPVQETPKSMHVEGDVHREVVVTPKAGSGIVALLTAYGGDDERDYRHLAADRITELEEALRRIVSINYPPTETYYALKATIDYARDQAIDALGAK